MMNKKLITVCKYELKFPYWVTEDGQVYSERTKKFLSPQLDKNGYQKVQMMSTDGVRHRYSVHRLVLENFNPVENMENLQVNHIDGNKQNNSLDNLEWVTCKENINHAIEHNLRARINGSAKLTEEQVIEIYQRCLNGETNIEIGKIFHIHPDSVGKIRNKKSWKNLLNKYFN